MNARAQELHTKADALEAMVERMNERGALHAAAAMTVQAKHMREQAVRAETEAAI